MPRSILLVDDDSSLRMLLDTMLTRAGYTTFQAEDGHQALEFIEMELPDIFIVDVMMPGMTGFELCRHLRADPRTANRVMVLLSALTDKESKAEGVACGANVYLTKPISAKELIGKIEELLPNGVSSS
jgi:CheY-like chemotaxis protein